jgi:hypothetical protein
VNRDRHGAVPPRRPGSLHEWAFSTSAGPQPRQPPQGRGRASPSNFLQQPWLIDQFAEP